MPRYFTQDHEWIDVDGDVGTVGITDYAQGQLGDITFVELPEPGAALAKGDKSVIPANKFFEVPAKAVKKGDVDAFWKELKELVK